MRPRIGISSRLEPSSTGACALTGVRVNVVEAVIAAGGLPVVIPLVLRGEWFEEIYASLDGMLLPGGEDVNPARFGESAHPKLGKISDPRDEMEMLLVKKVKHDKLPLLGICRGIQVINVALGGTLYQDIPDQLKTSVHHTDAGQPIDWIRRAHQISINPASRLFRILKVPSIGVNSLHHQGIKKLAPGLRAVALSPDNLIEAVEAESDQFFLALQCHPESMCIPDPDPAHASATWLGLFRALIDEARQFAERRNR